MNKNRIEQLEQEITHIDPVKKLEDIYQRFASAWWDDKTPEQALQIRLEADIIFAEYPQLKTQPGRKGRINRNQFLHWSAFVAFPETLTMP